MTPGLIVICGPTATGKSGFAQRLAREHSLPILNADSRQIYKDFTIGTAKPSRRDRDEVEHYLVDEISPTVTFTVADYQTQAQTLIQSLHQQGITPILAGGTGLYIKSITHGLKIPRVPPQEQLRKQLAQWPQSIRYQWLQQVAPINASKIHVNDQVRTLRALEVFYVTGQPLSGLQGEAPPEYSILFLGLDIQDMEQKTQRIRSRIQQMLEQGWLKEIQDIQARYGDTLPLLNTLGYAEMRDYLANRISESEAIEQTVIHTRQFAKRQRTWFQAESRVHWFDPINPANLDHASKLVSQHLRNLQ